MKNLLLTLLFLASFQTLFSQCGCNKVIVIADNSGSISSTEFSQFKNSIDSLSTKIISTRPNTEVAIVQYASQNSSNHTYDVSVPFTDTVSNLTAWQRGYGPGGVVNQAYFQDHLPGSLNKMRSDSIWNEGKVLDLISDSCKISFVIFTDGIYGSGIGCCSNLVNTGNAPLALPKYEEYNYLKNQFLANFSVFHVVYGNLDRTAGAAISSVGGTYTGAIDTNLSDPEGSQVLPRLYNPTNSFVISSSQIDSLIKNISAFSFSSASVCNGDSAFFNTFSLPLGANLKWDFGDGSIETVSKSPKHLYASPGKYLVSLIYKPSSLLSCYDTIMDSIEVFSSFNSDYSVDTVCFGSASSFSSTSTGVYSSVKWDFGDGTTSNSFPSASHTYASSGTFSTSLILSKSSTCSDTTIKNILVKGVNNQVSSNVDTIFANDKTSSYQWLNCDAGFNQILGATNDYFIPTSNGRYAVEVTNDGCVDTSACVLFSLSGISEVNNIQFNIYPNPLNNNLNISLANASSNNTIRIVDIKGKELYRENNKSEKFTLDISFLSKGIYFVEIINEENKGFKKFIKL